MFASPPFTATMPNAWSAGSAPVHCGYEMSYPFGPGPCAAEAVADALTSVKDANSAVTVVPNFTGPSSPLP